MEITFRPLASSSAGNSYLLSADKYHLLLDAGLPINAIRKALSPLLLTQLDGCLITHCHGDHAKSAGELMAAGVNCYASKETWQALKLESLQHRRKTLALGEMRMITDVWRVLPFEAVHDVPTMGFLIGIQDERILFLTDSAYSKFTYQGLTRIYIEANHGTDQMRETVSSGKMNTRRYGRTASNHMSIDRLVNMLAANDLSRCKEIVLLHLSDDNSDAEAFRARVQQVTGVPTYIAGAKGGVS